MRDLLHRAFGGAPAQLVLQALSEKKATAAELAEIRCIIIGVEKEAKQP